MGASLLAHDIIAIRAIPESEPIMCPIREDFAGQRQLRFRVQGKPLHLFKHKGESTHHVYLKVLAYAFYLDRAALTFDPKTDYKIQPGLAELDFTGEPRIWVQVGPAPAEHLEYALKHSDAAEVCLVLEAEHEGAAIEDQVQELAARLKRQIHWRYTARKLKILMFEPLESWFDADAVDPHPAHHVFYSF